MNTDLSSITDFPSSYHPSQIERQKSIRSSSRKARKAAEAATSLLMSGESFDSAVKMVDYIMSREKEHPSTNTERRKKYSASVSSADNYLSRIKFFDSKMKKIIRRNPQHKKAFDWAAVAVCAASGVLSGGGTAEEAQVASAAVLTSCRGKDEAPIHGLATAAEVSTAVLTKANNQSSAASAAIAVLRACESFKAENESREMECKRDEVENQVSMAEVEERVNDILQSNEVARYTYSSRTPHYENLIKNPESISETVDIFNSNQEATKEIKTLKGKELRMIQDILLQQSIEKENKIYQSNEEPPKDRLVPKSYAETHYNDQENNESNFCDNEKFGHNANERGCVYNGNTTSKFVAGSKPERIESCFNGWNGFQDKVTLATSAATRALNDMSNVVRKVFIPVCDDDEMNNAPIRISFNTPCGRPNCSFQCEPHSKRS